MGDKCRTFIGWARSRGSPPALAAKLVTGPLHLPGYVTGGGRRCTLSKLHRGVACSAGMPHPSSPGLCRGRSHKKMARAFGLRGPALLCEMAFAEQHRQMATSSAKGEHMRAALARTVWVCGAAKA